MDQTIGSSYDQAKAFLKIDMNCASPLDVQHWKNWVESSLREIGRWQLDSKSIATWLTMKTWKRENDGL